MRQFYFAEIKKYFQQKSIFSKFRKKKSTTIIKALKLIENCKK